MSTRQIGESAPPLELDTLDGKKYALNADRGVRLTLAAFMKTTCPVCQYAWPFLERLHQAYRQPGLHVVGISPDAREATAEYEKNFSSTFPFLLDTDWKVSRAYDPAFVPTLFLISSRGKIIQMLESWNREAWEDLSAQIARELKTAPVQIVRPEDEAAAFMPG